MSQTAMIIIGVPVASLACALLLSPFVLAPEIEKDQAERRAREALIEQYKASVESDVQACMQGSPWECFADMRAKDVASPVSYGPKRTEILAARVPAATVLSFCTLARKVDCADSMAGTDFATADIQSALLAQK